MKNLVLLVGVLMCAAALFTGCREGYGSRTDVSIEWRSDPDHQGYYLPPDSHHHGDRDHRVYNEEHRDDNNGGHQDRGDQRSSIGNTQSGDEGVQAIQQYCAQHSLPAHITSIEPLADNTKPGSKAESATIIKRYKVTDAKSHNKVVDYNPNTGALAIE